MDAGDGPKLDIFLKWLQKGYGVFASDDNGEGESVYLERSSLGGSSGFGITPMRVLQEPTYAAKCRPLFEEGDVDDRFLIMLFLTVERAMKNSSWKPYLDMLPSTFGSPLWYTESELLELKGTALHKATILQKKKLQELFNDKLKPLAEELIHGDSGRMLAGLDIASNSR